MALIRGTHYFSLDESHAVRLLAAKLQINRYFVTWWIFLVLWPLPLYFIPFAEMEGEQGVAWEGRYDWVDGLGVGVKGGAACILYGDKAFLPQPQRERLGTCLIRCLSSSLMGGWECTSTRGAFPPNMVGGERTTRASTASSLKLRRANARRPLTHSSLMGGGCCGHYLCTSYLLLR